LHLPDRLLSERQHLVREGTFRYALGLLGKVLVVVGLQDRPLQGEARGCPVLVTASSSQFQLIPASSSHLRNTSTVPNLRQSRELVVPVGSWWCCCENTIKKGQITQDRGRRREQKKSEKQESKY